MTEAPSHLVRHLVDDVLAWWVAHGPDDQHGGVLTCWNNAGTELVTTDKYTCASCSFSWSSATSTPRCSRTYSAAASSRRLMRLVQE